MKLYIKNGDYADQIESLSSIKNIKFLPNKEYKKINSQKSVRTEYQLSKTHYEKSYISQGYITACDLSQLRNDRYTQIYPRILRQAGSFVVTNENLVTRATCHI